jgi:hypothetical protein
MIKIIVYFAAIICPTRTERTRKKDIEKLCGCFGVDFKYAEAFSQIRIINIMIVILPVVE